MLYEIEPSIKTGKKRKHQASIEVDEESDSGHGSDSDELSDSDLEVPQKLFICNFYRELKMKI